MNLEKYRLFIENIIKKSFPLLKNKPLIVRELKNSPYTAKVSARRNKIIIKVSKRISR